MDNLYLCKVEFISLVEKYNLINTENSQYNEGVKNGLEEGIRGLARALNIKIYFDGKKINYDTIPLYKN